MDVLGHLLATVLHVPRSITWIQTVITSANVCALIYTLCFVLHTAKHIFSMKLDPIFVAGLLFQKCLISSLALFRKLLQVNLKYIRSMLYLSVF